MSTSAEKKQLRQMILRQRNILDPASIKEAASSAAEMVRDLADQVFAAKKGQLLHVAAYAAMRKELDLAQTWSFWQAWPADLYFPAVRGGRLRLARLPRQLEPAEFLAPQVFGIPEPPNPSLLEEPPSLDLVLVPGLAFGEDGSRVGWGKAYYDGLLASLPGRPWRVGIGYDFQLLDQVPQEEHDIKLDAILTPTRLVWCGQ